MAKSMLDSHATRVWKTSSVPSDRNYEMVSIYRFIFVRTEDGRIYVGRG